MDTESDREPLLKPLVPTQPRSVAGIALIRHIQCIHIAVVCPFPLLPVEPGYRLTPWAWVQPLFYGQGLDGLRSDQNKHGQGNPLALTCPSHSGTRQAHLQQPGSKTLLAPNYSALPACWGGFVQYDHVHIRLMCTRHVVKTRIRGHLVCQCQCHPIISIITQYRVVLSPGQTQPNWQYPVPR